MFVSGSVTATGQIIAQTINVQSVTSSVVYSSGSNVFGCQVSDTQTFTGSMFITGSTLNVTGGSICAPKVQINTSVNCGALNISGYDNSGINIIDTRSSGTGCYYSSLTFRDYYLGESGAIRFYHNQGIGPSISSLRFILDGSEKFLLSYSGVGCFSGAVCAPTLISSGTICSTGNTCFGGMSIVNSCLGIGTSSPAQKLEISSGHAKFSDSYGLFYGTQTQLYGSEASKYFRFDIAGTSGVMFLSGSGNVGINTTTPSFLLDVYQPQTTTTAYVRIKNNRTRNAALQFETNCANYLIGAGIGTDTNRLMVYDNNAGATRLTLDQCGNLGLATTPAAWVSTARAFQINSYNSIASQHNGSFNIVSEAYENTANAFAYGSTGGYPTRINMNPNDGVISIFNAATGTAGCSITWCNRFTIQNSGLAIFCATGISAGADSFRITSSDSTTVLKVNNTAASGISRLILSNAERDFIITNNAGDDLLSLYYGTTNRIQFDSSNTLFPNGIACFGSTVCAPQFIASSSLRVSSHAYTFTANKAFNENTSDVEFFKIAMSGGQAAIFVQFSSLNSGTAAYKVQTYHGVLSNNWSGWVGCGIEVTGNPSCRANFAASSINSIATYTGCIVFRVSTTNNGTSTTATGTANITVVTDGGVPTFTQL